MKTAYLDGPGVLAMAHRGFSRTGLENSMAAFAAAVDLGFRYVETDVHATSDGVLLALHDSTLDRVTDRTGVIADLPWSAVREAKIAGTEPIPTFDELLETWPELRINIDCKAAGAVQPLAEAIERHGAHDRVCIASFSDRRRRSVLRQLTRPTATSAGPVTTGALAIGRIPLVHSAFGVDCIQIPQRVGSRPLVTARLIRSMHAREVQVHVWTVDDPDDMHRLLDLGVDGLITDRSDVLKDVLQQRNQWV
ncbi:glycerophosphodiester phosphodiesterase [Rudaeicoccus suwonensis]|uniref:Glycerophosphoryl diester phosphodiesterase n=1 Tax=Rudaeicoccus suwonensis TaxID=657409 RepID=A0A561EBG5_9MICO|nr:glycerophosphodiester phosphodiesterase [Rudaeicoccus suwonensis]TWE12948.1 glycerophosphoryl diester phosphodiesterase [Rudaeicoccus suwonensis]